MCVMTTTHTPALTPEQMRDARGWLADCGIDCAGASDADVVRVVSREHDGGLDAFLRDGLYGADPREADMPADYWHACELHGVARCPLCHKLPGDCDFGSCCEPATTAVQTSHETLERQCDRHAAVSVRFGLASLA